MKNFQSLILGFECPLLLVPVICLLGDLDILNSELSILFLNLSFSNSNSFISSFNFSPFLFFLESLFFFLPAIDYLETVSIPISSSLFLNFLTSCTRHSSFSFCRDIGETMAMFPSYCSYFSTRFFSSV